MAQQFKYRSKKDGKVRTYAQRNPRLEKSKDFERVEKKPEPVKPKTSEG